MHCLHHTAGTQLAASPLHTHTLLYLGLCACPLPLNYTPAHTSHFLIKNLRLRECEPAGGGCILHNNLISNPDSGAGGGWSFPAAVCTAPRGAWSAFPLPFNPKRAKCQGPCFQKHKNAFPSQTHRPLGLRGGSDPASPFYKEKTEAQALGSRRFPESEQQQQKGQTWKGSPRSAG